MWTGYVTKQVLVTRLQKMSPKPVYLYTDSATEREHRRKLFPLKYSEKALLHFWQVIWINSSKLSIGSSLSLLPTKCQKWWNHIYLSIWMWLEGQLSIKLKIDDNQTYYSICEKQLHQIQETDQSKWVTAPSKINWETWVSDLWLLDHD